MTILICWFIPIVLVGYAATMEILQHSVWCCRWRIVYALKNARNWCATCNRRSPRAMRHRPNQIGALWRMRERTLHQLADRLHDEVLADLRGGRMVLESWQSGNTPPAVRAQQLNFLVDALGTLYRRVRDVVDEAKPMDWRQGTLGEAIQALIEHFHGYSPEVTVDLSSAAYDEADPTPVKDALYDVNTWGAEQRRTQRAAFVRIYLDSRSDQVRLEIATTAWVRSPNPRPTTTAVTWGIASVCGSASPRSASLEIVSRRQGR
ncbi:MAG: hypothetical protein R2873_28760 [Caldilineaceae bacterium]